ncbi:MAG: filamentous hemagglutinin N-terminal domain-containing protein [Gammaproteobacteria bacterium]
MGRNNINKKRGKSCKKVCDRGASAPRLNPVTAFIRASLPAGLLLGLPAGSALAGPEGGVVAAGQGSIANPDASTTVVNQSSQNLIVNWESFNVNTHETVNFKQPNKSAQALNRIFDQNPSQIFGSLNANGKVLLINPNGVFFSPTARVNVGGLVASGLNIKDEDFMAGKHTFFNQDGSEGGMVVNQGLISAATGGSVTLIGGAVKNEGTILATAGQVNLVAGKKVTMDFDGDGLIQFTVDEEILQNAHDLDDAISNSGTINADGGSVLLHGKAAKDVFTNVVNNSGVIGANKIQNEGGQIKLVASGAGNSLLNTGIVDASSSDSDGGTIEIHATDKTIIAEDAVVTASSSSGKGGKVQITGDKVGLMDNSTIDVSGENGGGEALIGGDFQGNNPEVVNASKTYVAEGTTIKADAVEEGDGGRIIVWADDWTKYYGSITATGGSLSGNGGFVEVSGKEFLDFNGQVDTSAENGAFGTLLLDPRNLEITDAGSKTDLIGAVGDDSQSHTYAFTEDPSTDITGASGITSATIESLLDTNNVFLQANNDITVTDDIDTVTAGNTGDFGLTLEAGRSILINNDIILRGSFTATANSNNTNIVEAERTASTAGVFTMADGVTISTTSGAADGNITINMSTGEPAGTGFDSGDITLANLDAGAAHILVNQGGQTAGSDILRQTTSTLTAASVALDISNASNTTGTIGVSGTAINTNITNLELRTQGGSAFINETDGVDIGGATLGGLTGVNTGTGDFSLTAGGAVTDTESIIADEFAITSAGALLDVGSTNVNEIAASMTGEGNGFTLLNEADGFTVGAFDGVTGITTAASTTSGTTTGGVSLGTTLGDITITNDVTTGTATVAEAGVGTDAQSGVITITAGGTGVIQGIGNLITGDATVTGGDGDDTATVGNISLIANEVSEAAGTGNLDVTFGLADSSGGIDLAGLLNVTTDGTGADGEIRITSTADLSIGNLVTTAADATTIHIEVTGGEDLLYVNANTLDDNITFIADEIGINNDITRNDATAGTTTISLQAASTIELADNANITSSAGLINVTLAADTDNDATGGAIVMNDGSSIVSNGGNIVLGGGNATGTGDGALGTASDLEGVLLDNAVLNSGAGDITITGTGRAGTSSAYGVDIGSTTTTSITSTGGTITIIGTGGAGTASNMGVRVNSGGGTTSITNTTGNISITGTGGNSTGNDNNGIQISNATVSTTGGGLITFVGKAGDGNQSNHGVDLINTAQITSDGGAISITGQASDGGATGNNNTGIVVQSGSDVAATNAATITLNGTSSNGLSTNDGVRISGSGSTVTSVDGLIDIDGTANGSSNNNRGVQIISDGLVQTTGAGSIDINGVNNATSGAFNIGVQMSFGSDVTTTGGGNITIVGQAANIASTALYGFDMVDAGTTITTGAAGGDITITGTGSTDAGGSGNGISGVTLIQANGAGNILLTGNSTTQQGLSVGGTVSSASGNMTLLGTTAASGATEYGVQLSSSSTIGSGTSTGDIIITGNSGGTTGINVTGSTIQTTGAGTISIDSEDSINFASTASTVSTAGGSVTLDADSEANGTGDVLFGPAGSTIDSGAGTITFRGNEIDITSGANTITGTGDVVFEASQATTTVGIAGGAGTLDLSTTDLAALTEGFNNVIIGRTDGTGAITVNAASFKDAVTLRAAVGSGFIAIDGQLDTLASTTNNSLASITLDSALSRTTLSNNVVTEGAAVTLNIEALVNGTITIDTTNADASAAGTVTITGAIDGANLGGTDTLTIDAAQGAVDGTGDATVELQSDVEGAAGFISVTGGEDLQGLTINGGQIDVADIVITGGAINLEGTNIDLNDTTYQTNTSGAITFTGAVDILAGGGMTTVTTSGGAAATFTGAVTGDLLTGLTVNTSASNGLTDFQTGANVSNLTSFTVNAGTGDVDLQNVTGISGAISITGGDGVAAGTVIDLESTSISAGTSVSFFGDVNLAQTGGNTVVQSGGAAGEDISFSQEIDDAGNDTTLTLVAGAGGDVTISGNVGDAGALQAFNINSADLVNLQAVTVEDGGIDIGAVSTIGTSITLNGDLNTDGLGAGNTAGALRIDGPILLAASVSLDANDAVAAGGSDTGTDGAITLSGTIQSTVAWQEGITLDAGSATVDTSGATISNLDHLAVTAASLSLGDTTLGDGANNAGVGLDVNTTGNLTLNGDISTAGDTSNNAGGIDLAGVGGNILLNNGGAVDATTVTITANATGTDAAITLGTVQDNGGNINLAVDAGTADATLNAVGTTDAIGTLTVAGNDIAFNGNVESTSITATAVEGGDADSINIAAGVTLDANGGNMSFRSDDIIIDGTANLISTGGATSVTFAAEADGTAIGLGDSAAGVLNLSETELNRVGSTFGEIIVGVDTSQSGAIEVNDSGGLTIANTGLRLRAEAGGADITIGSNLNLTNATSALSIEGSFATTNLDANITTTGGTVNIADDVLVNGARTIDTTAGNTVNAASITITGFIDGANSAGTDTLTLDAARNGVDGVGDAFVDLQNDVEGAAGAINVVGGQDLEGLTITGSQIDVANVRVEGSISISGTNIDLNGTTYRSDDNGGTETISFTGPVDLHNNVVVTGAGGASENISFSSTINADDATANNRTLTVNASAGSAIFGGAIGVAQPLADFDVTAATINLNGGTVRVDDQGGNTSLLTGAVILGSNVTIDTDGAVDNNLNIAGTINADDATANNRTLAVTAGTGTATFGGIIGGTQQLADFDVTANTINLNTTSIRVDDNNAPAATSTMTGAVRLGANLVYDTDKASGADSSVTFTNTVNADAVGNNRTLTVTAGGGTARFQNAVGGTQALADFDATANLIRLQGNVTANAGAGGNTITLTGPVQIENNVTINTDGTNDNNVSLTSTVNALNASTADRLFAVTAGTGNITIGGAMGGTQALDGGVTLTGATINTAAITTNGTDSGANKAAGAVTITGTGGVTIGGVINATGKGTGNGGAIDIDAGGANPLSVQAITANSAGGGTGGIIKLNDDGGTGTITLNGDLTSTGTTSGGNITLGTATQLGAATINISTGATAGNITFDNTLNSTAGSNRALVLTAGTGNVTLSGIAGGTAGAELLSFSVNSANNVSLQALTTDTGAITIGTNATTRIGGILTLNGNLTSHDGANAAGAINLFADDIRLVGAGPGTITLNSNGSADAAITIATDTGGGGTLASNVAWLDGITLDAGGATVDLGNAAFNNLDHLDITANTLSLGDTTLGDGAGNGGVGLDINTTGNLTLNGDISTAGDTSNNAGGIDLAGVGGNILLNNGGAVDATTVTISANATGTDAAITLGTVQDNGSDINLAVDAGTADATLNAVGTTDAIGTLTVAGNDIAFNGNVESTTITATAAQNGGDNDSIAIAGGVTLDANGGNMTFRTDDIAFPGSASLTSTGGGTSVTFAGETDATTIGLGTGSAGTLQLTQDELNIVDSTFTEIIVGVDGTQSGTIQVDDSGADNNLTINNTGLRLRVETAPGDIDINSTITLANTGSDFNIEGAGDTTLLSGDITTNGGDIIIDDTVLVDGTRTLDSGNSATAAAAGLIQITGDIGSVDTTGDTLTLDARSVAIGGYGTVDVIGDVGAGTVNGAAANDLTGFTVFGNQVDVANIEVTSGNIALSAVTNIDLNGATYQTTTSGSITIGAELGAGSGTIDLDQAGGTTTVQTAGGAGDDILIESPIRDGDATQLTLNAGAGGDVTADTIGDITPIGTVDVDGDQISLDNISVDNGDIFVTGNNIDLNSGFTITTAGEINVTGPVLLTGASSSFSTPGGAGDNITFSSTIDDDAAGDNILVLDADAGGAGNVTVGGAIGGITRVRQVDIDGVVINVDSIRVDGVATGAANIFVGTLGTTTTLNLNGANYDSINSPTSGIIRFDGPVTLNQGAATTTTVSSTSGANSDITFRGTVDDNVAGNTALVVNAGVAGDISFQQAIGDTTPIASLTITNANQLGINNATTTGFQSITAGAINLSGTTYESTTSGTISFFGPVNLFNNNVTVTSAGGVGNDISFSSTIDADDEDGIGSDRGITLVGGAGDVTVTGAIGGSEALDGGVTISGATISTGAITTDGADTGANKAGGAVNIDATGGTIIISGAISAIGKGLSPGGAVEIDADGTNAISVQGITTNNTAVGGIGGVIQLNDNGGTGLVTLNGDLTSGINAAGGAITLGSATELATGITISTGTLTGDITFDSTLNSEASENNTLGLTAGTGSITLTGAVASGLNQELGAVTVNSANNVTATSTLEAASFTQIAGTGTTQINGQMDLTAAGTNTSITTDTIDLNANINTNGGNVVLSAASGVTLDGGTIDTTGILNAADTTDDAGTVDIDVTGAGNVALTGNIDTTGADSNASAAGDGGLVTINTFDGDITVNNITTSGGVGTGQNGGNAAQIQLIAGDDGASFGDDITIGTLTSLGGAGAANGSDNNVTLTATSGAIVDGNADAAGDNVQAAILIADARDGVGSGNALETTVTSIDIDNSNANNIEIAESDGLIVTRAAQATDADANDIIISTTTGDIEVDSITTGGVDSDVTLTASAGAVTDRLADTNLDITADVLTIDADTGVGSANALETVAATFDVDNNTSGNIDIDNNYTTGLVTLTNLNVAAGAGTISFDNTGNQSLTITSATTNTGGISITNTGDANTDTLTVGTTVSTAGSGTISLSTLNRGDIAINGGIDASTSGGTITVSAADNMSFGVVTLTTGVGTGQINLNVDSTNTQVATLNLTNATLTSADINLDSGAAGDTLIGQNVANTWTITGADTGTLGNANLSVDADYTDFDNLTGNADSDLFDFNGGTVSGNVDGAGGTNTLDYAGAASGSVTLVATGSTTGFSGTAGTADQITGTYDNITTLVANSTADTLTGIAAGGTFGIDGTNQYVSTNTLDFSGYGNLTGGDGADIFNVSTSHTGNLDGARGDDIFNLSVDGTIVTGTLQGGDGDDTFNFSDEARVAGNVDGGIDLAPLTTSDNDVINFSGSTLVIALSISGNGSDHGQTGTILENGAPNFDLITGIFDNVDSVIGNGGLLVGPNAVTFWNITGADSGTFGGSLATIGDNFFNSFQIQGNVDNDTFVFVNNATARISGGIDGGGGAGTDVLVGSLGVDTFDIDAGGTNVTLTHDGGAAATVLTGIENIDNSVIADTAADVFNINNDWSGSLHGAGGADTFTFADTRTVGGTLTGGAGIDIINWNAYTTARNVTITGSAADGFDGNETSITGGFVTIDDIRGSTTGGQVDTITGQNGITATWTVNSGGTQYSNTAGPFNLAFSNFENLTGGSGADTFNVTGAHSGNLAGGLGDDVFDIAATLTGSVNGEGGSDTLQGALINSVVLTGSDASGFDGTEADVTLGFDGIDTITGNGGTLTGQNTGSTWLLDGTPTYNNGTHTLNFSGFANLQGGTDTDAFNVTSASTFNLLGGDTGIDTFTIDATLTGSIDGETGADVLQGTAIDAVFITSSDADGYLGTETDITGGFDGIGTINGNGGTLTGSNTTNTWNLDGTPTFDDGTVNPDLNFTGFANLQGGTNTDAFNVTTASTFNLLGGGNVDTFDIDATLTGSLDGETGVDVLQGNLINNVVLTGSDGDGFAGTEADITGGFDGISVITGNGGTLTGRDVASTWGLDGTPTYSDGNTLNFTGFANLQGGTNTDAFNVTAASAFNLAGGTGVDTFDIGATLTGSVAGNSGADVLQGNLIDNVTLTGVNADGFSGTEADITANFSGITVLNGNNATLTGLNAASNTTISGGNSGSYTSTNTLTFTGVQNLNGGNNNDSFTFTNAGSIGGNLTGGGGIDTLIGDDDGNAFVVTGANTGTLATKITGTWSGIENLTGGAGADTFNVTGGTISGLLNGAGGAGDSATFAGQTVTLNGTNTGISNIETVNMGGGTLVGSAGTTAWNLNGASSGTANDGTTAITFTNTPTVRGGTGTDTFTANGAYNGTVNLTDLDNTWNYTPGATLTNGAVTGSGSLTIPGTDGVALNIAGGDLVLPNLAGFNGHTIIGGALTVPGATPYYTATAVDFNTTTLTVTDPINSGGSVTLLGGDVILNNDITLTSGTIGMVAGGPVVVPGSTGIIDASAGPVTLTAPPGTAPSGAFVASDNLVGSENITLAFGGGEIDLATGAGEDVEFNGASISTDIVTDPQFEAFVNGALAALGVNLTTTFSINPASALIGLETLAFIDLGLFEEELQLFGTIGTGIALALAQCEEQEGCAPNVTEDELNTLIATLEARIEELRRRLEESESTANRVELEDLIDGFNKELQAFNSYLAELQAFFSAEAALEEELEDDFIDDEPLLDGETGADEISVLAGVLETIQARIDWLESLKEDPEERNRLSEATGLELTLEELDKLIEAARAEAAFIENRIRLLIEGTEARLGVQPIFTAEARNYDDTQVLHYGPGLLQLDNNKLALKGMNIY